MPVKYIVNHVKTVCIKCKLIVRLSGATPDRLYSAYRSGIARGQYPAHDVCPTGLHKHCVLSAQDVINNYIDCFEHLGFADTVRTMLIERIVVYGLTKKRVLEEKTNFQLMQMLKKCEGFEDF